MRATHLARNDARIAAVQRIVEDCTVPWEEMLPDATTRAQETERESI